MSPRETRRRAGGRTARGSTGRRRGRAAGIVVAALALVGLGVIVGVAAVMFGLIPGFGIRRVSNGLAGDSARGDSAAVPPAVAAAPDTAPHPAIIPPLDSAGAPLAAGAVTAADSAAGEIVYRGAGKCLSCHAAAGEGVAQLGPNLRDERWIVGDGSVASIARAVREGIAPPKEFPIAMPAYGSQLPADAINRVAAYVYSLSHAGAVQRDSLAPRPDSARVPAPAAQPPVPRPTVPAPGPPR